MSGIDDPTMRITDDERSWALAIKEAVEHSSQLDNLCDMFYAQYAIITEGDLPAALTRIQGMQTFLCAYSVDNSIDQGVHYLKEEMIQQPGFLLTIYIDVPRQISYLSYDCGMLRPDIAMGYSKCSRTGVMQENWKVIMAAAYYKKLACQPSLATIRNGFTVLADFGDYDWNNFSLEMSQSMFGELLDYYPMNWNHFFAYNTGYLANVLFGLAKQVMTPAMKESVQLGCSIVEPDNGSNSKRRLKDFYYQPSREAAEESLLDRARLLLAARQCNEQTFRL